MDRTSGLQRWKSKLAAVALFLPISFLPIGLSAQASRPSDALALEQQGKLAEAAEVWRTVIQKDPDDAAAVASLGVILSKEHKYQEAAAAYKKALSLDPKLPGVQLNLGLAEFKQGHFPAAIPLLKAARTQLASSAQARPPARMCARTKWWCGFIVT